MSGAFLVFKLSVESVRQLHPSLFQNDKIALSTNS